MAKRALLVGCNYPKTQFRLYGCINDVLQMQKLLLNRFHFDQIDVKVLTDELGTPPEELPTHVNIMAALRKMVDEAKAGDVLFFHFSGHGTTISTVEPGQPFREDEAIVPCDLNLITDMDLRHLIQKLDEKVSFTILSDSCYSGGLIDQNKEQIGPARVKSIPPPQVQFKARGIPIGSISHCLLSVTSGPTAIEDDIDATPKFWGGLLGTVAGALGSILPLIFKKDVSISFLPENEQRALLSSKRSLSEDEGILLSASQANETSADLKESPLTGGEAHGAFTYAVLQGFYQHSGHGPLTNQQLVKKVRKFLQDLGLEQHPCLYCSDGNADAPFLLHG
ncbi:hypothetical protein V6N13_078978 [Hibiscus sabdariffa]|uniref:Peptidase C14 caspase domain-containing protein n=1 Tax=Hibiscus sabdariffa TaxID=183260 RepID=A0ABR2RQ66_9ROSI